MIAILNKSKDNPDGFSGFVLYEDMAHALRLRFDPALREYLNSSTFTDSAFGTNRGSGRYYFGNYIILVQ